MNTHTGLSGAEHKCHTHGRFLLMDMLEGNFGKIQRSTEGLTTKKQHECLDLGVQEEAIQSIRSKAPLCCSTPRGNALMQHKREEVHPGRASQCWRGAARPIKAIPVGQAEAGESCGHLLTTSSPAGFSTPCPPVPNGQMIPSKPGEVKKKLLIFCWSVIPMNLALWESVQVAARLGGWNGFYNYSSSWEYHTSTSFLPALAPSPLLIRTSCSNPKRLKTKWTRDSAPLLPWLYS